MGFEMVLIFLAFLMGLAIYAGGHAMFAAIQDQKAAALPRSVKLSEVSKQLKREYDALPEDSRPFPDITSVLVNLDEVTGTDPVKRRRHFDINWLNNIRVQNGGFHFSWDAQCCSHYNCDYRPYWELHNTILEVKKALEEKEKALRSSKFDQDGLLELQQRLRDEAGIQKQIARELS